MDFRTIFYVIGLALSVEAGCMLIPLLADLHDGNEDWKVFLVCSVITAFFGGSLVLANAGQTFKLNIRLAFLLTVLGWLAVAVFGALPFRFSALDMSYSNALFESMAGITTTATSVIANPENAPKGILLWRAILQWLGGLGIIIMALTILPYLKVGGMQIFRAESSGSEKALPRTLQLLTASSLVYFSLTALCAAAYALSGLTPFDSVAHAMTTLSAGGFSTKAHSFIDFKNPGAEIVAIVFMLLSGTPIVLILKTLYGKNLRILFYDRQVQAYLTLILFSSAAAALYLSTVLHKHLDFLRHGIFTAVSIITGTGFVNSSLAPWGGFGFSMLIFLMLVGGCAGSTAGGIKIFRFQIVYAIAVAQLKKLLHPNGVFNPNYGRVFIAPDTVVSVLSFFCVFGLIFCAGVVALCFTGLDLQNSILATASALCNAGFNADNIEGGFASLTKAAKWTLSALMLTGRLEIFTVLVLFSPYFWKK